MVIKVAMPRHFQFRVVSTLPSLLMGRGNDPLYRRERGAAAAVVSPSGSKGHRES